MRISRTLDRCVLLLWLLIALCMCARPAYAYADPGAGLFLMQVIGSTFLGFTFVVRNRIVRVFSRFFRSKNVASDVTR